MQKGLLVNHMTGNDIDDHALDSADSACFLTKQTAARQDRTCLRIPQKLSPRFHKKSLIHTTQPILRT